MKRLLLLPLIVAAAMLAACTPSDKVFGSNGPNAGEYKPYVPAYYDASQCKTEFRSPAGDYCRLPAQRGAFHYLMHDPAQPLRQPLKDKTWKYTSRMPSQWGAPIFVTTAKTERASQPATAAASSTPAGANAQP